MNDVVQFIEAFLEEEYRTLVAQYTERDQEKYQAQEAELLSYFPPKMDGMLIGHRPLHPDEKFFAIGERKMQKQDLTKRTLFQVKQYEHPDVGVLYRGYVGPDKQYPKAPTYDLNLFITGQEPIFTIIAVYSFNRWYPQRKGRHYFIDNGLCWNYRGGVKLKKMGTLRGVRKFVEPRDCAGSLAEYHADGNLEESTIPEGLETFIERLRQGDLEFYSRFQEDEWGCRYLGDGRFERWSRNYMENRDEREELDEAGVIQLFARYPVEHLQKRLIARGVEQ